MSQKQNSKEIWEINYSDGFDYYYTAGLYECKQDAIKELNKLEKELEQEGDIYSSYFVEKMTLYLCSNKDDEE